MLYLKIDYNKLLRNFHGQSVTILVSFIEIDEISSQVCDKSKILVTLLKGKSNQGLC